MTEDIYLIEKDVEIYAIVLGATKKDGKKLIASSSQAETVLENKQLALQTYSKYVEKLERMRSDGFTSGCVSVFRPMINRAGHIILIPQGDSICEYRFGDQKGNENGKS